jgi:hypothetical protein
MAGIYLQIIASSPDGVDAEPIASERLIEFREVKKETKQNELQGKAPPTLQDEGSPAPKEKGTSYWDVEPARRKFIYLFGKYKNGTCKIYEIITNEEGKFDQYQLPENESEYSRPSPVYEDYVIVDNYDTKRNEIIYYVMISDMKLPHKRFFDPKNGLKKDPSIRAADIDDPWQTCRKVTYSEDVGGEVEICGVKNYLKLARLLNQGYQNALNRFYKYRYNLSLSGEYPEDIRLGQSDDENAPHFINSQESQNERLKRFAASIVLALIKNNKQRRDICLENHGSKFSNYIIELAKPERQAYTDISVKISLLSDILSDPRYSETINDYLLDESNEKLKLYVTDAVSEIVARFDESEEGRKLIGECYNKGTPILGKNDTVKRNIIDKVLKKTNDTLEPTELEQKALHSIFRITNNICKYVLHRMDIDFAQKEKLMKSVLFINVDLELIEDLREVYGYYGHPQVTPTHPGVRPPMKMKYYIVNKDAFKDRQKLYTRYKNLSGHLFAALNTLSLLRNIEDVKDKKDCKSTYLALKDLANISVWLVNTTYDIDTFKPLLASKGITSAVVKKIGYTVTAITGTVDTILNGCTAYKEFAKEGDVDAGIFKTIEMFGSGFLGASGICFLTGVGAGVSLPLAITGSVLSGIGGVGYLVTNDDAASVFLKNCPWGIDFKSQDFSTGTLKASIDTILTAMYSFEIEASEEFNNSLNIDIIPKIVSPYMKIELQIKVSRGAEPSFILNSNNSTVIHNQEGRTIIRYNYPNYDDKGMKIEVNIDTYGDGTFCLPKNGEYKKFTKAPKSIFDDYLHRNSLFDGSPKTA